MPLNRIGVEITEPVLRTDLSEVVSKIVQLRAERIAIALDDVGHDRIPLLHLTELPVDVVKLDRCLITGIDKQPALRHVVHSLAGLCERLDLTVIAEGVETAREETVLRGLGVRYVQGFRFARPATIEALSEVFDRLAAASDQETEEVA